MIVRENAADDVLASLTAMEWNTPSKAGTGGATMADASLNRRMTVRFGDAVAVAVAQIGIVGLNGQIELGALRLYALPEDAPAPLTGTPTVPVGVREFAAETALDLPSLAGGAVHLVDVTVDALRRARRGGLVQQHRARAGAQRLGWRLRLRRGNAVGAGDDAKGAVCVLRAHGPFQPTPWRIVNNS